MASEAGSAYCSAVDAGIAFTLAAATFLPLLCFFFGLPRFTGGVVGTRPSCDDM
jgi:hypothetical protein